MHLPESPVWIGTRSSQGVEPIVSRRQPDDTKIQTGRMNEMLVRLEGSGASDPRGPFHCSLQRMRKFISRRLSTEELGLETRWRSEVGEMTFQRSC
jgi:hypothetical protein